MNHKPYYKNQKLSLAERLVKHMNKINDCWEWSGSVRAGYGAINVDGRTIFAHRASFTLFRGGIPKGLFLDHLCRNKLCINPAHLDPVTHKENVLRGIGPTAINARKKFCNNGHAYDELNTFYNSNGNRGCKTCKRQYERNYQARKKALKVIK